MPGDVTPSEDDRTVWEKVQDKFYEVFFGWECPPKWYRFAWIVECFVMDPFVDLFITLCIVGNTILMAIDHADIEPGLAHVLNVGNNVSTPLGEYCWALLSGSRASCIAALTFVLD